MEAKTIEDIVQAINDRLGGMFSPIRRIPFSEYIKTNDALNFVEALGKRRYEKFRLDNNNYDAYSNAIKWLLSDETMTSICPQTNKVIKGDLKKGLYIAGGTGTGKTYLTELLLALSMAMQVEIQVGKIVRQLTWQNIRADEICEQYATKGAINEFKTKQILCIQDLGTEPLESSYMGNCINPLRQILEARADRPDTLTIITSNIPMCHEHNLRMYGDRVISRLPFTMNYLTMSGGDRRQE